MIDEDFGIDRFDKKIVRPHAAGEGFIFGVRVGRGIDDDGNVLEVGVRFPCLEENKAVHDRHEQIRNNYVGRMLDGDFERLGAMMGRNDLKTVTGKKGIEIIEIFFPVINDKNLSHDDSSSGTLKREISATKESGLMGFSM